MENYRFSLPVEVRFADLDVLGHLNNAKYLTYAEQARILYNQEVCGWDGNWRNLGMILVRTEIDYKTAHCLWGYCDGLSTDEPHWGQKL